jgi:hypothetical protein
MHDCGISKNRHDLMYLKTEELDGNKILVFKPVALKLSRKHNRRSEMSTKNYGRLYCRAL